MTTIDPDTHPTTGHSGPGVRCPPQLATPADALRPDFDVSVADPKPIPSAVPGIHGAVGPAAAPRTPSTLISQVGGALLGAWLITVQEGREVAAWVKSHDCEPQYVYVTHPHADHFLALPEILAAFPEARPVALAESIPAMQE